MTDSETIAIDTEIWGGQEFFEVIASRYFELGNEGPIAASWGVRGIDGKNTSDQLIVLNRHLEPLGLLGELDNSNPPVLSISGYPLGQHVLRNWQEAVVWLFMSGFMTMVGASWIGKYGYDSSSVEIGTFGQSFVYFTIPIVVALLVASYLRSLVANRFGVEAGHIVPIVFPIPTPSWPFGIIGTMGQRRIDLVPIPNRRALGLIEIVVPLTLFLAGTILTILGLSITSNSPPSLQEAPVVFETNMITQLLADSWLGDDFAIRLQWLHPTGIAGIGLSIIGWGLILPIPGFPGDRVLHSLVGPSEMRDDGVQTSIFVIMLVVLVIVFATSEYMPWIFLAAVGAWQRFSPESVPQPLVVDEHAGLAEQARSRLVSIVLIMLIAGFPGTAPSGVLEDFDSGISVVGWPEEVEIVPGENAELHLVLRPNGVLPVSGWLQMRIEGASSEQWEIYSECIDSSGACQFSNIIQAETYDVAITISPPESEFSPHILRVLIDVPGNQKEHVITLVDNSASGPLQPFWTLVEDGIRPIICISVNVVGELGVLSTEDPFWEFANETEVEMGEQELCMIGHEGALQSSSEVDGQNRKFGPEVRFEQVNLTNGPWRIAIEGSEPVMQVDGGEWGLPDWFETSTGYVINHADDGAPFCPSTEMAAEIDTSSNWTRALEEYSPVRIIGNLQGNGSLGVGEAGWLVVCTDGGLIHTYRIVEGVDVMVEPGGIGEGLYSAEFVVYNRGGESLPVAVEWHGDSPHSDIWNISLPSHIEPGENAELRAAPIGELHLFRSLWVSADTSGITIHLAARCPVDGCE